MSVIFDEVIGTVEAEPDPPPAPDPPSQAEPLNMAEMPRELQRMLRRARERAARLYAD